MSYTDIINNAKNLPKPILTVVAYPCDRSSLKTAHLAEMNSFADTVLVGPYNKIDKLLKENNLNIKNLNIVNTEDDPDIAARKAVDIIEVQERSNTPSVLMKGSLHTDALMSAVLKSSLRTDRRLSHNYVVSLPSLKRLINITDAAINVNPTLKEKVDIIQNVVDFFNTFFKFTPKAAILSAVETVTDKVPSTLDAAMLCKMADRGQIKNVILDGPFAYDNVMSAASSENKNISCNVVNPDILIVPNLEAGNILAKCLIYSAGADAAGIVLGAKIPIILTSRSDSVLTKLTSCALSATVASLNH